MGLFGRKAPPCAEPEKYFDSAAMLARLELCPHDYRCRSALIDKLYILLQYREFFPLQGRKAVMKLLEGQMDFFTRLPRARAVPRLEYLNAAHRLYRGNLAFCGGDIPAALEEYSAVLRLRCFRGLGEDSRLGKAASADYHELLPIIYNMSQAFNLLGLEDKSRALYARYGDIVYLRRRELSEQPSHNAEVAAELRYLSEPTAVCKILMPAVRYDLRVDFPPLYDSCCEEKYSEALGKTCYIFRSGFACGQEAALTISERDGEEYWQAAFCSEEMSRKKLITEQAARVAVSYNISGKEK